MDEETLKNVKQKQRDLQKKKKLSPPSHFKKKVANEPQNGEYVVKIARHSENIIKPSNENGILLKNGE